jgi:hypothetical protein
VGTLLFQQHGYPAHALALRISSPWTLVTAGRCTCAGDRGSAQHALALQCRQRRDVEQVFILRVGSKLPETRVLRRAAAVTVRGRAEVRGQRHKETVGSQAVRALLIGACGHLSGRHNKLERMFEIQIHVHLEPRGRVSTCTWRLNTYTRGFVHP